mmetsp:Transcript_809/g.1566  ORF Transcript_809/g.1566 Transcript_809/m.1566 type:complete len:972 (-) Transcript_809:183-3098(-)
MKRIASAPRTEFGQAPPGYVPGLGRGAVGFTTRSDIGPARPTAGGAAAQPEKPKETDLSESNYDEFSGYSENLFAGADYDKDDEEADAVYLAIDTRMDSKRKTRREELLKQELAKYRTKRPRIQEQFRDLKNNLGDMSTVDWEEIPEAMDYSRRNKEMKKNRRMDRITPAPDSLLEMGAGVNAHGNSIMSSHDARYGTSSVGGGLATPMGGMRTPIGGMRTPIGGVRTPIGGMRTPMGGAMTPLGVQTPLGVMTPLGGPTDLTQLGRARDKVLSLKLDRMADSVSGQTVVDPKGYLTDLNHVKVNSETEVSDIKKARLLLKSVITTNPKHAPGWIAAARLEKETGKLAAARAVIMKGCEICPTSEDCWLEAARLQTAKNAKSVLAKAIQRIPQSVKIWMAAASLETETEAKKIVFRRALEMVPNSIVLWKNAIQLETPEDARIMLDRAVELVPEATEMWLALARLSSYKQARVVLNRARVAIPTEPSIWITAAMLEEANGNNANVRQIIHKAVKSLEAHQVVIDRDSWLKEAEKAEKAGSVVTCQALIKETIGIDVEEQDRKPTWLSDAENFLNNGSVATSRAIYAHLLEVFPGKKSIWLKAAHLEKQFGTAEQLDELLASAVKFCPTAETLWLMAAKEKWLQEDISGAQRILSRAFEANQNSEQIWLAAVKLESENNQHENARKLLTQARERAGTARVWMKSAKLERALGHRDKERLLLMEALNKFSCDFKLWIMMAQLYSSQHNVQKSSDTYKQGCKNCPHAVSLWICYARHELDHNASVGKARSILETARLKNPATPRLWLEAVRVEERGGKKDVGQSLMAKALQECPASGLLWAHAIATDARPLRKARSYDALKRCSDDPYVFAAVAKLFWIDRKVKKARNWFNRAVTVEPDLGDAWAWFYKFELEHGSSDKQKSVVKRCIEADPRHGELWCNVAKRVTVKDNQKIEDVLKEVVENLPADIFDIKFC